MGARLAFCALDSAPPFLAIPEKARGCGLIRGGSTELGGHWLSVQIWRPAEEGRSSRLAGWGRTAHQTPPRREFGRWIKDVTAGESSNREIPVLSSITPRT